MSTAGPTAPRQGDAPLVSGGHVSDLVGHCSVSLATRWGRHAVAGIRGKGGRPKVFVHLKCWDDQSFTTFIRTVELSFFCSRSSPLGNEKQGSTG